MKAMTPSIDDIKKTLKQYVSKHQLEKVFEILKEIGISDNDILNQITIIEFGYNGIIRGSRENIVSHNELIEENAKIAKAILSVIDLLNEENFCNSIVSRKGEKTIIFRIDAEIDSSNEEELTRIISELMKLGGDNSIRIDKIKRGSIIFEISLSEEAYEKLISAHASGELSKVLNYKNVEILGEKIIESSTGNKRYEEIYNRYFTLVYLTVYKYYPYKADEVTAEVFNKELFPAVDRGHFKTEKDPVGFILKKAIHYCVTKRFEEIYRTYFDVVYSIVYRYHPYEVDDITSDVFERKILPAIRKNYFVEDKDYTGLIVTITKNRCYTYYQKSSKSNSDELTDDSIAGELLNPTARIDLMIDLSHALEQLSRKQCLVMLLTIEGYADDEIAKTMSATVQAIRQLRFRARKRLKKILGDLPPNKNLHEHFIDKQGQIQSNIFTNDTEEFQLSSAEIKNKVQEIKDGDISHEEDMENLKSLLTKALEA